MLHHLPAQQPGDAEEYAVRCDVPGCDLEVAAPTADEALEAAALMGFRFERGGPRHRCPDCNAGRSLAAQAAIAAALQQQQAQQAGGPPAPKPDPTGWLN